MKKLIINSFFVQLPALCLVALFIFPLHAAAASEILSHKMASKVLAADYPYRLYLPDGYEEGSYRYPVLYLLHGNGGNETDWTSKGQIQETVDRLISTGQVPPLLIVMPGNGTSWWVDGNQQPAETVLIKELIPHIDASFRSLAAGNGRMIAGISAGGYGTVNAVFKYPELFAAAAALSPAVYLPLPPPRSVANRIPQFQKNGSFDPATWQRLNYPANWETYRAKGIIVPLYISSGDHDTFSIAWHSAQLFQKLFAYQPQRVEFRVVDGDHNWRLWRKSIADAIKYMARFTSPPVKSENY